MTMHNKLYPSDETGQTQLAETCSEFTLANQKFTRISKLQSTIILVHHMYSDVPM